MGELSPADQQAMEHEIKENPRLRTELEAVDLTDALLKQASIKSLPQSDTVGTANTVKTYWPYFLLSALAIAVLIFKISYSFPAAIPENNTEPNPKVEEKLTPNFMPQGKESPAPIAQSIPAQENIKSSRVDQISDGLASIAQRSESVLSVNKIAKKDNDQNHRSSVKNASSKPNSISEKIAVYTVQAVIDTALSERSNLALTATEKIVLKPGFHAKAGTSFKAKVDNRLTFN